MFLDAAAARAAFSRLTAALDLDGLDGGSLALMPQLGRRLLELGVSDPRWGRLQGLRQYHWCKNVLALREASELQTILFLEGIPSVVLKGLAVLPAYADLGLRPMHDIDFLVSPADHPRAERLLTDRGWRFKLPHQPHGKAFVRGNLEIDLHAHSLLEDPRGEADAALLNSRRRTTVGGVELTHPSATLTLAHLLVHGARFSSSRPIHWAADAIHLLRQGDVDWEKFRAHVLERQLMVPVFETLSYLHDDLRVALPPDLLEELRGAANGWHWLEFVCHSEHPRRVGSIHRTAVRVCHRARVSGLAQGAVA